MCLLHVEIAFDLGRNKKRPIPSLLPLETQCRFSRCRGPCSAWRSDGVTLPDPNVHPAWSVIVHTSASPQSPGDGQLEAGAGAAIPRAPLGQVKTPSALRRTGQRAEVRAWPDTSLLTTHPVFIGVFISIDDTNNRQDFFF